MGEAEPSRADRARREKEHQRRHPETLFRLEEADSQQEARSQHQPLPVPDGRLQHQVARGQHQEKLERVGQAAGRGDPAGNGGGQRHRSGEPGQHCGRLAPVGGHWRDMEGEEQQQAANEGKEQRRAQGAEARREAVQARGKRAEGHVAREQRADEAPDPETRPQGQAPLLKQRAIRQGVLCRLVDLDLAPTVEHERCLLPAGHCVPDIQGVGCPKQRHRHLPRGIAGEETGVQGGLVDQQRPAEYQTGEDSGAQPATQMSAEE